MYQHDIIKNEFIIYLLVFKYIYDIFTNMFNRLVKVVFFNYYKFKVQVVCAISNLAIMI